MTGLDKEIKEFHNTNFTQPFLRINFHIPDTKGYDFYASGKFIKEYCENAKIHQPREGMAENFYSYGKYMQDVKGHDGVKIPVCQSANATNGKVAEQSIVFDSVLSICEEDTKNIGLLRKQKGITEYFFNQFCDKHKFDKTQWAYFSALHTNTDNDHLHIVFYQPENCKKVVKSKFLETQQYAYFDKKSKEFKEYVAERKKVVTPMSCIKNVQNHLGMMLDQTFASEPLRELLRMTNELKAKTKHVIANSTEDKVLLDLARSVQEKKGDEGRLQYANLVKWAKIKPDDRIPGAVENQKNMKILVAEVDASVKYFMENKEVKSKFTDVFGKFEQVLGIGKDNKTKPGDAFKFQLRKRYFDEQVVQGTKTVIANAILQELKNINVEKKQNRENSRMIRKYRTTHPKFANQKSSPSREYAYKEQKFVQKSHKNILSKMISYALQMERENLEHLRKMGEEWMKSQMELEKQQQTEM